MSLFEIISNYHSTEESQVSGPREMKFLQLRLITVCLANINGIITWAIFTVYQKTQQNILIQFKCFSLLIAVDLE